MSVGVNKRNSNLKAWSPQRHKQKEEDQALWANVIHNRRQVR